MLLIEIILGVELYDSVKKGFAWARKNHVSIVIAIVLFVLSLSITFIIKCLTNFLDSWNYFLLFFAVYGGTLAIWARWVAQEQLKLSQQSNNNQIFSKASEMLLSHGNDIVFGVSGSQLLIKLAESDPKNEYIRCAEFACRWLKHRYPVEKGTWKITWEVRSLISNLFGQDFSEVKRQVEGYKEKYDFDFWPVMTGINLQEMFFANSNLLESALFDDANLMGASLQNANVKRAEFKNAILKNADLTNADMQEAKNLTEKQILSARWYSYDDTSKPPKLPHELEVQEAIQKWLSEPWTPESKDHWDRY